MIADPILRNTTARACKATLFAALVLAQQARWPDVIASLYQLHADVDARVRRLDYEAWCAQLGDEGPHQPEAEP